MLTVVVPRSIASVARQAFTLAGAAAATAFLLHFAAPPAVAQRQATEATRGAAALEAPLRAVAVPGRVIALTFDISWGAVMPPKVVAILQKERVAATFFLSGPWVTAHPEMVRAMAAVPDFEIESHGQAHVNFSALSAAGVAANINKASAAIYAVTGKRPTMLRPPNGDYSRTSLDATAALGLRTVIWDTDSHDWMNPGVGTIVRRVVARAHPGDIVLLHASDTCRQTDLALPTIIAELRQKGYRFVTVARLLDLGSPLGHSLN